MLKALFLAIVIWESDGNIQAFNAQENAAGIAQIRPCVITDVNDILKRSGSPVRYSLADRYRPQKAYEIYVIYITNYCGTNPTPEQIARTWNGGPRGASKASTVKYWHEVKAVLDGTQTKRATKWASYKLAIE